METEPLAEQVDRMTKTDTDEAVFVGVDIAKDRFDFAARPSGGMLEPASHRNRGVRRLPPASLICV